MKLHDERFFCNSLCNPPSGIAPSYEEPPTHARGARARQPQLRRHLRALPVTYASGDEGGDFHFGSGGIFVINAASAKGLQFDTVLLADIDGYRCNAQDRNQCDDLKRRFYVMISRACEQVILLRRAGRRCPVDAILPDDPTILAPGGDPP